MSPRSSPNELQEDVLFYQSEVFKMGFEFDEQKIKLENLYNLNKILTGRRLIGSSILVRILSRAINN